MSYSEERLYYACTNFCEAFFKLLCEKDKIRSKWRPDDEKETRLRFANEYLNSAYETLFKAIEDWENEKLKSRIEYLERKIERERNATNKQYEKWEKEALEKINKLEKDNAFLTAEVEALKQIKPIRKLPRKLTVLKLDDGDVDD